MRGRSDKETQIVEAAARLFARFGPRKTTIDDIAREAGLGKGTIYLYFDKKEEIFMAYVRARCEEFHTDIEAAIAKAASAEEKIRVFLTKRLQLVSEHLQQAGVTKEAFKEVRALPELVALRGELMAQEQEVLKNVLEMGVNNNEFTVSDPALAAVAIAAAAEALASPWVLDGREIPYGTKAEALADLVVLGIKRTTVTTHPNLSK